MEMVNILFNIIILRMVTYKDSAFLLFLLYKYCDASEDYNKHPKQCDKLYNIVEKFEEHPETTTNED